MATVAAQLVDYLVQAGVRRIYGIVGDSLNPVVDEVFLALTGHTAAEVEHQEEEVA